MPPIIADTFRVAFDWEGPNQAIAENVIHIQCTTGDATDVYNALLASVDPLMWAMVSDQFQIGQVDITELVAVPLTLSFDVSANANFGGTVSGDYIPNCSALVKHTTALGGRSGRGRTYLPALAESRQQDGTTAVTQRNQTSAAWVQFQADLFAEDPSCLMVVASYTNETTAVVTNSVCEATIATQRRRNRR